MRKPIWWLLVLGKRRFAVRINHWQWFITVGSTRCADQNWYQTKIRYPTAQDLQWWLAEIKKRIVSSQEVIRFSIIEFWTMAGSRLVIGVIDKTEQFSENKVWFCRIKIIKVVGLRVKRRERPLLEWIWLVILISIKKGTYLISSVPTQFETL